MSADAYAGYEAELNLFGALIRQAIHEARVGEPGTSGKKNRGRKQDTMRTAQCWFHSKSFAGWCALVGTTADEIRPAALAAIAEGMPHQGGQPGWMEGR